MEKWMCENRKSTEKQELQDGLVLSIIQPNYTSSVTQLVLY